MQLWKKMCKFEALSRSENQCKSNSINHTISEKMELKKQNNQFSPPNYAFIMISFSGNFFKCLKLSEFLRNSKSTISMIKSMSNLIDQN